MLSRPAPASRPPGTPGRASADVRGRRRHAAPLRVEPPDRDLGPDRADAGGPPAALPRRSRLPRRRPRALRRARRRYGAGSAARGPDPGTSNASGSQFWRWLLCLYGIKRDGPAARGRQSVVTRSSELGTTLVEFDRDLGAAPLATSAYAAYRVLATAAPARRISSSVLRVTGTDGVAPPSCRLRLAAPPSRSTRTSIVARPAARGPLGRHRLVAIVDWASDDLRRRRRSTAHKPFALGGRARARRPAPRRLEFAADAAADARGRARAQIAALGGLRPRPARRRAPLRLPERPQGATPGQLRLYPAP